jgi:K+-sensing histidine kinase KdpD
MVEPSSEDRDNSLRVPWSDAVRFIRQLSHDLRNHLNAIELQSAYISELERDEELKSEIKRLREMVSGLTSTLQRLSRAVDEVQPSLISYRAVDFMEDLRKKIGHDFSREAAEITWDIQLGDAILNIDPQLLQEVFTELFANAFRHDRGKSALVAMAKIDKNRFLFTLCEPKVGSDLPTENWGREPLRKISQNHYGLGLNRVHAILEAHSGEMHALYDSEHSTLVTRLSLPASGG